MAHLERLLTAATAAARIGITEDELHGRILTGQGPRPVADGEDLYRDQDINAYIAAQPSD